MKKLFLVDAYALIFKYYYAFLGRPMRNREGMNTSVVFGFVKFLRDIQKRERPDLLGVAFDPKGGSFRRDIFPEYKANRSETPEDILLSIPYVKRVLDAMCIPILEVAGYEADDVIGTLSQKGVEAGYDVYMVTPDKDYGQLVRDNCRIYKQRGAEGSIEIVDREAIREKYGIDTEKYDEKIGDMAEYVFLDMTRSIFDHERIERNIRAAYAELPPEKRELYGSVEDQLQYFGIGPQATTVNPEAHE